MSVRRLADDAVQPETFKFNPAMAREAKGWIKKYPKGREQSAVIPLLMLAQEQDGWVTKASIEHVSDMLDMPLIRVLEVATFYTQFQLQPVGTKAHVQICGTTPCMLRGSEELIALCKKKIHPEPFQTNEAGTLSWEEVECQGACVNAPMVMIFKDTYEDLTVERLEEIIDAFEAGKGDDITPGPQIDRIYSAPEGGLTSLTDEAAIKKPARKKAAASKKSDKPVKATAPGKPTSRTAKKTNTTMKLAETATGTKKAEPAKAASRAAPKSNATMKLASSASGRGKHATKGDAGRPVAIKKPAKPDDLQLIAGIGPKIEGILHELGIWTWAQIAEWKKAERDWINGYLRFKGRIEREEWVKQAKALAKGGVDEYIKVFGKEPR